MNPRSDSTVGAQRAEAAPGHASEYLSIRQVTRGLAAPLLLACVFPVLCFAQSSLHQAPEGTVVEGMFVLARKAVPLPAGKFTLVVGREQPTKLHSGSNMSSNIAEVVLVQTEGVNLRVGIWARANVKVGTLWSDEPCKRTDTLFKLDRTKSFNYLQDCVIVNHFIGLLRNPNAYWTPIYDVLISRGVALPVATALDATLVRIDRHEYLAVTYWINPAVFGFAPDTAPNWNTSAWHKSRIESDPQKVAFVKVLSRWVVDLKPVFDQGFKGKAISPSAIPPLQLPTF